MDTQELAPYQEFAKKKLGFEFRNPTLIITALTHRSYVNEHKKSVRLHNERLEFLGDAVLELVTSDFLYQHYDEPEGIMTAWRSALVNTDANAAAGERLGYAPLIRLSKGEKNGSARAHHSIVADCYEAIIGAIYLDRGYKDAEKFIKKHSLSDVDALIESEAWRDAKSYLQELAQKIDNLTPTYHVIKEEGPDHNKTFTLGVYIGSQLKATGVGRSKQEAEVAAASEAIRRYKARSKKRH